MMTATTKHPTLRAGAQRALNRLNVPHYDGADFTWTHGHGVTEISTLCGPLRDRDARGGYYADARIWNDACDVGFTVTSHKTRQTKLFFLVQELRHGDEVSGWLYVSDDGRVQITIVND